MIAAGRWDDVVLMTYSEFGRRARQNASDGTDHGTAGPQFVMGGAVKGGVFYGQFPNLAMGGPDDASDYGAWIPTTSFDQYGATLARWFGVPLASLTKVFPALSAFPIQDVGFLG